MNAKKSERKRRGDKRFVSASVRQVFSKTVTKPVKKQSGDRASSLAAKYLNQLREDGVHDRLNFLIRRGDLKTLCASVLSQDETRGPRTYMPKPPRERDRRVRK